MKVWHPRRTIESDAGITAASEGVDSVSEESISRRQFVESAILGAAALGGLALGGCGSAGGASSQGGAGDQDSAADPSAEGGSSAGADAANGASLVVVYSRTGNTLQVAQRITEVATLEMCRIEPTVPYPESYNEIAEVATEEQEKGTLPEFTCDVPSWEEISTVYLGFPTWYDKLPQIVLSFLATYDCSGKVIYPFNTSGGSGFGGTLGQLAEACPEADIRDGLTLPGDTVADNLDKVDDWLSDLA